FTWNPDTLLSPLLAAYRNPSERSKLNPDARETPTKGDCLSKCRFPLLSKILYPMMVVVLPTYSRFPGGSPIIDRGERAPAKGEPDSSDTSPVTESRAYADTVSED